VISRAERRAEVRIRGEPVTGIGRIAETSNSGPTLEIHSLLRPTLTVRMLFESLCATGILYGRDNTYNDEVVLLANAGTRQWW